MPLDINKLEQIIALRQFDALIGEFENEWFDCKAQPYHLKDSKSSRELAKDVSSFANTKGGYILLGVQTQINETHLGDEITEIKPFDARLVNRDQYFKLIKEWVYPEVGGIAIDWLPASDEGKGIVLIKIPPQPEENKPFLIKNVLDEEKQVEIMFGYAQRRRDNSEPYTVRDLQTALRFGLNYDRNVSKRFDDLEEQVRQIIERSKSSVSEENIYETIDQRINATLSGANLEDNRVFVLSAFSEQPKELKTFGTSENSIKQKLQNPPYLRSSGWTLRTHERARIVRGELLRVMSDEYKIIDLYRDGTLIFAVVANGNFLAWGRDRVPQVEKINPVALIEVVYNYTNFYGLVLEDMKEKPKQVLIRIDLKNMRLEGVINYLAPYGVDTYGQLERGNPAPDNHFAKIIKCDAASYEARVVGYEIVKEIYLWFGLEEDTIPYTIVEGSVNMIDPEQISKL